MKNLKTIQSGCAILIALCIITSCKKELQPIPSENKTTDQEVYQNENNVLVFKSTNVLRQKIEADANENSQSAQFQFPGFVSMKQVFDKFDKEEASILEKLSDSLNGQYEKPENYLMMSTIGKNNKDMILIKQFPENNEYYYDMNIGANQNCFANYVNPKGLLIVNDSIYQFSEKYIKIITDGDFSKISSLSSINNTDPANHVLVFNSADFILGYDNSLNYRGACSSSWTKTTLAQANNKRVELRVLFQQNPDGNFNKTTLTVGLVSLKKKVAVIWVNATANYLLLSGQFSASRAPKDINGNAGGGYILPNPFNDINYSSERIHFIDYANQYEPCYTMTHATYKLYADFSGGGCAAFVSW